MVSSQIHKPFIFKAKRTLIIVKASVLLLLMSCLLSACSTTQTDEPKYTDFYEVKQYEIKTETYTNEIITTVFIQKFVETNKVSVITSEVATDFGGYEFEPIEVKEEPTSGQIEFQCVDGSCEVKK